MPANSVNREVIRDAFAALLQAALVGVGLPAQTVYGYRVGDFQKQSPVVTVSGVGVDRQRKEFANVFDTWFVLSVHVFVAYADQATGWTEAMAEDRLDLIEKKLADVVMDNQANANWNALQFRGVSTEDDIVIAGADYRRAIYTVAARVIHG